MAATDREMIEAWLAGEGQSAESWGTDPEEGGAEFAQLAGKWRVVEDVNEEEGPFADEEGTVRVSIVGAEEHHNRRVVISFRADDTDADLEAPFDFLEPA